MTDPSQPSNDSTDSQSAEDEPANSRSLGSFIRAQRKLANLSVRQLSSMAEISNAYLSQIERDLHEPSLRVVKNVSEALGVDPQTFLSRSGFMGGFSGKKSERQDSATDQPSTEDAIAADPHLTDAEKQALLAVYRSYRSAKGAPS